MDVYKNIRSFGERINLKHVILTGILTAICYLSWNFESPEHTFNNRQLAIKELKEAGVTKSQKDSAYKAGISEFLSNNVYPYAYTDKYKEFFAFLESEVVQKQKQSYEQYSNIILGNNGLGMRKHFQVMKFCSEFSFLHRKYFNLSTERRNIQKLIIKNYFSLGKKINSIELKKQIIDLIGDKYPTNIRFFIEKLIELETKSQLSEEILKTLFDSFTTESVDTLAEPRTHFYRKDLWKSYLGLKQDFNTLGISNYFPAKSISDKVYYNFRMYESNPISFFKDISYDTTDFYSDLLTSLDFNNKKPHVMEHKDVGQFTINLGRDINGIFISFYDIWDFSGINESFPVGRSLEIYDRIYFKDLTNSQKKELEEVFGLTYEEILKDLKRIHEENLLKSS